MKEIFSMQNIVIYLLVINVLSFLSMYIDKKKAKKGKWRTQEKTLLILATIGGAIGSLAGMYTFRHKTKKARFAIGIPVILVTEIICVILFLIA